MSNLYEFVAHEIFHENVKKFLEQVPQFKKSIITNLEKARSNPFSGKQMHSLPKKLKQKVFRLRIGGAKDFRLIYYVDKNILCVFGIFLTLQPRGSFSYETSDWLDRLETIVTDLENEQYEKFYTYDTEEEVLKLRNLR